MQSDDFELLASNPRMEVVGLPEAMAFLWAASVVLGSRVLPAKFGVAIVAGGPRWRSVTSMLTQLLVFPLCLCTGPNGERAFIYIFALYMLLDFLLVKLETLFIVHHIFCLIGHAMVVFLLPEGMPIYFPGVVVLEIGSGMMNQFALYPERKWRALMYAVGMTTSNGVALWLCCEWSLLPLPIAPKVLNVLISTIMIALRQKTCYKYLTQGPQAH